MRTSYTWERLTGSRMVSPSPVHIVSIIMTPTAASAATVTVYDGESATDPVLITIKTNALLSQQEIFTIPLKTHRGLYIAFTLNVAEVLVHYGWEEE